MQSARLHLTKSKVKVIISLFLVVALACPPLINIIVNHASAASLTSYKVNIGDSRAAVATYHRFEFVTPSTTNIKTIDFQYCTTPSGTCTAPDGMILTAVPTVSGVSGIGGTVYTAAGTDGTCTGAGNTDCTITLTVGTPGAQSAGATVIVPVVTGITNPSTVNTTYYVKITTKDGSTATIDGPNTAAFGILDTNSIAVSATVDPNFTFTVTRAVTGTVNGDTINVSSTTNSSIPFGTLNTSVASVSAHDITISTNAGSGYLVTASNAATITGNPPLVSGSTNHIDRYTADNDAPSNFTTANGTVANSDTGFFGYTTEDATLDCTGQTANRFTNGGPKYAGFTTTGMELVCSTVAISNETTRVGWKLAINAVQPAGAYSGSIILVATPTY